VGEGVTTAAPAPLASLVVVTCGSSPVLGDCVASFRREASGIGIGSQVVVVDHSESGEELQRLRGADVDLVEPRTNRGYAAGLNSGVELADGDLLLLANPDIEFLPGSLQALVDGLDSGFSVVGPQLVWDQEGPLFLPPPEDPAPSSELRRAILRRWPGAWRRAVPREVARANRLWSAEGPVGVPSLRGPLMALRRQTWRRLEDLDENYFLYYEETDWLWRARRAGARLALAGDARVVHRWGHAARSRPDRGSIEARSRRRFRKTHYPWWWRLLLAWAEGGRQRAGVDAEVVGSPAEVPLEDGRLHLLSPFGHLMPAAGWVGARVTVEQVAEVTGSGRWHLAAARHNGRQWRIERSWTWVSP
jgi:N-acetylglucosaminyl-diphospho-decaprenol L-rhamnosyltransferase